MCGKMKEPIDLCIRTVIPTSQRMNWNYILEAIKHGDLKRTSNALITYRLETLMSWQAIANKAKKDGVYLMIYCIPILSGETVFDYVTNEVKKYGVTFCIFPECKECEKVSVKGANLIDAGDFIECPPQFNIVLKIDTWWDVYNARKACKVPH
jgi:hypothetical protein